MGASGKSGSSLNDLCCSCDAPPRKAVMRAIRNTPFKHAHTSIYFVADSLLLAQCHSTPKSQAKKPTVKPGVAIGHLNQKWAASKTGIVLYLDWRNSLLIYSSASHTANQGDKRARSLFTTTPWADEQPRAPARTTSNVCSMAPFAGR